MQRMKFIDGLKGLAALLIVFHHLSIAYFPSFFWADAGSVDVPAARWLSTSALALPLNGNFFLAIFCIVSGYLLTAIARRRDAEAISEMVFKRFLRLAVPVFAVCVLVFALDQTGLFRNLELAEKIDSPWLTYFTPDASIVDVLLSPINIFILGRDSFLFSNAFWMLPDMLFGGFLAILIGIALKRERRFQLPALLLTIIFLLPLGLLAAFPMGSLISYLTDRFADFAPSRQRALRRVAVAAVLVGLFLGAYPSSEVPVENYYRVFSIFAGIEGFSQLLHLGAATLFIFGLYYTPLTQRFFELSVFDWLNQFSYSLYIVHVPVIMLVSPYVFELLESIGYVPAALLTIFITATVCVAAGYGFYQLVEKRSPRLINWLSQ